MAVDYGALKSELDTDPLTRGYSGMTDGQVAVDLNTVYRSRNRTTMSGREVMEAFAANTAEWDALTAANQDRIIALTGREDLDPFGIDAHIFTQAAAGATNTISALNAARTEAISRAVELGFGTVHSGDVANARAI